MVAKTKKRKFRGAKNRFIGKPHGQIQERVQAVGPERFGVVAVDCAKRRSKFMLCNFYGKVIVEPATVEHTAGGLRAMTQRVAEACQAEGLSDSIAAVEMTGIYHKPVYRALRQAGFDTRIVHPFASNHYRRPLHPNLKTDDHDLEAIFHAAINGYGLAVLPVNEVYQSLQAASRHRHNLVKQRSRLMVQIRRLLHLTMPGYADLFDQDRLYHNSIALPVALEFSSAEAIQSAGAKGLALYLNKAKARFQTRTIERIVAWSATAAEPAELAAMYTQQCRQLNEVRCLLDQQIVSIEQELAGFLVKTPYILLLTVAGLNVVSTARLAGEAGPIEHYASARAINGRAGLYPSRYQSDEVDHADGALVRQCNRKLRGAAMMVAENLIRCQLVAGRQVWRGHGIDREYLLAKLQKFHRDHNTPVEQSIRDLNEAFAWLPKSTYATEAKPLAELARKKRRGPQHIGDFIIPLLLRLGVTIDDKVESNTSEARSSD